MKNARTKSELFVDFGTALSISCCQSPVWLVAAYVRQETDSSRAKGLRCLRAIKWGEEVTGWDLHSRQPLVRAQASTVSTTPKDQPRSAPNITENIVHGLESLLVSGDTLPIRVWAGLFLLLALACLRTQDLLLARDIVLTDHAIVGESWMKKAKVYRSWAAPRISHGGIDAAGIFVRLLRRANLPGPDFLLVNTPSMHTFGTRIATYDDARVALVPASSHRLR